MSTRAILKLRHTTSDLLDRLHQGVNVVRFLDFPDHTNVGDSAIALGSLEFWRQRGISLSGVHPLYATPRHVLADADSTFALQGGGSFGGLYPPMNNFRLRVLRELHPEATLIQMPQSVVFPSELHRRENAAAFASRPTARVGARDRFSFGELQSIGLSPTLTPDSAHMLGPISCPSATTPYVILARTDPEAAADASGSQGQRTFDWPRATIPGRVLHRIKFQREWPDAAQRLADRPPQFWIQRAQRRLAVGIPLLAEGSTIITDRLHAMILGLHLGRRVIAIDNANQKLSNYASTWLTDSELPLEFSETFADAVRAAKRTTN
ncbi:polysaccharide pyruvyl transferase family protein [Janibacter hoylei]